MALLLDIHCHCDTEELVNDWYRLAMTNVTKCHCYQIYNTSRLIVIIENEKNKENIFPLKKNKKTIAVINNN